MAEYSDPLIALLQKDFHADYDGSASKGIAIIETATKRRILGEDTEAAAWAAFADKVRAGQEPVVIAARLRIVTRLILYAGQPDRNIRGVNIPAEDTDAALRMTEYLKGEPWQKAVLAAKAILQLDFAGCEYDVEP